MQGLVRKESVKILVVIGFSDSVLVSLPVGSLYLRGEIFSPGRRKKYPVLRLMISVDMVVSRHARGDKLTLVIGIVLAVVFDLKR